MCIDKIRGAPHGEFVVFNLANERESHALIERATVVISLLPPPLHPRIMQMCLALGKHMFTASFVSDEMQSMHPAALSKGLLFMNECGLDPGIDHMYAMRVIDGIKQEGGTIVSLKSFCGAIIAPDTDVENPWRYKFTWNPQSVVRAGQGTARWLCHGQHKYIPYWRLFQQTTAIAIPGHGEFVGYVNRDSTKYIDLYALNGVETMVRGTLRTRGFCAGWNVFVQLGCADDTYRMKGVGQMTHCDFIESFLPAGQTGTVAERVAAFVGLAYPCAELGLLAWSGCFEQERIGLSQGTPAQILEHILKKKWSINPQDKDMVVMWLACRYMHSGQLHETTAHLAYIGDGSNGHTAIAKGVGLPLGMAAKRFLQGKIPLRGVRIPTDQTTYAPILRELGAFGIHIQDSTQQVPTT